MMGMNKNSHPFIIVLVVLRTMLVSQCQAKQTHLTTPRCRNEHMLNERMLEKGHNVKMKLENMEKHRLTPYGSLNAKAVLRSPDSTAVTPADTRSSRCNRSGRRVRSSGEGGAFSGRITGRETKAQGRGDRSGGTLGQTRVGRHGSCRGNRARSDGTHGANGTGGGLGGRLARRGRISSTGGRGGSHRLIRTVAKDRVDGGARRRGAVGAVRGLQSGSGGRGMRHAIGAGRTGRVGGETKRVNPAGGWASHTGGRGRSVGASLAVGARRVIREAAGRKKGRAFIAV